MSGTVSPTKTEERFSGAIYGEEVHFFTFRIRLNETSKEMMTLLHCLYRIYKTAKLCSRLNQMKTFSIAAATLCLLSLVSYVNATEPATPVKAAAKTPVTAPAPHCEVPCGIYADQMRFEQMLEDTATIAKAISNINEFAGGGGMTGKSFNQASRWVTTKENHATNTQHIIAQYFLTQRIKSDHKEYTGQLATAHRVMVAAMKCKQDSDPATAEALKKSIYDLYRAYEGKEPAFENDK